MLSVDVNEEPGHPGQFNWRFAQWRRASPKSESHASQSRAYQRSPVEDKLMGDSSCDFLERRQIDQRRAPPYSDNNFSKHITIVVKLLLPCSTTLIYSHLFYAGFVFLHYIRSRHLNSSY